MELTSIIGSFGKGGKFGVNVLAKVHYIISVVLTYGREVWGFHKIGTEAIDRFSLSFLKYPLKLCNHHQVTSRCLANWVSYHLVLTHIVVRYYVLS